MCLPVEAEAGIGEAVIEAIKAEGFSPDGESFLLTLHILDEVRGDTEMKKDICQD